MGAYYNEFDTKAAAWLRELIKRGLIADGDVDERDLWDVTPDDLRGYTQVHLCAGIGVWSYALRRAGWDDDQPVWTGSFPCQPFSSAGKGAGFADERHLWPAGCHLIRECRPGVLLGEQVASKDAEPWLDLVQADLEGLGYAFGACAFPSAGVGAPHIRDRTYWVAQSEHSRREARQPAYGWKPGSAMPSGVVGWLGYAERLGAGWNTGAGDSTQDRNGCGAERHDAGPSGAVVGLADADRPGTQRQPGDAPEEARLPQAKRQSEHDADVSQRDGADHNRRSVGGGHGLSGNAGRPGPTNGLWRDADWLFCRDGKWRPVEPGTFPLAHGAPARVGRLRGYGNAINAEAATAWIESYIDALEETGA